jgi:uncharacterized protein YegP (UPF0339 family)
VRISPLPARNSIQRNGRPQFSGRQIEVHPPRRDAMAARFEVYQSGTQYRIRLRAVNGEIVASGEAYESKAGAHPGCRQ